MAFSSAATNLLPSVDGNGAAANIFVRDLVHGTTAVVSLGTGGAQGNAGSFDPAISANGSIVVFGSSATNLVPGEDSAAVLFVRNLAAQMTTVIRIVTSGASATRFPGSPSISGDGRMVAFRAQTAPSTIGGAPGHFVHDRSIGATAFVAVGSGGHSFDPLPQGPVLRDGGEMFIDSVVTSPVQGDTNGRMDVFAANVKQYSVDVGVYASAGTWFIFRAFDGSLRPPVGAHRPSEMCRYSRTTMATAASIAVYRSSSGEWFIAFSSGGSRTLGWGAPALLDEPVPADYAAMARRM